MPWPSIKDYSKLYYILILLISVTTLINVSIFIYSPYISNLVTNTHSFNEEYVELLSANFVELNKVDILKQALVQMKAELRPQIVAAIKKEVDKTYKESYLNQIRDELLAQHTKQIFKQDQVSGILLQSLRGRYINTHDVGFKHYLTRQLFEHIKTVPGYEDKISPEVVEYVLEYVEDSIDGRKPFFEYFINDLILGYNPEVVLTKEESGDNFGHKLMKDPSVLTKQMLLDKKTKLTQDSFENLQTSHDQLVTVLNKYKDIGSGIFSGEGIVINSNKPLLGTALVMVLQLRELKSMLPIEIIVPTALDADNDICKSILPNYNAKCVAIETILPSVKKLSRNNGSFFKLLAIVTSSFDTVISLDSSNFPITNVDKILESPAFLSTHCLLWPGLLQRTTSPIFYDIARIVPGEPIRRDGIKNDKSFIDYLSGGDINFHDLSGLPSASTTDTSQMVVTKSKHLKSLILALYYNYYGPTAYYRLIYQGAPGESDKDTYIPALTVFEETFHQVETLPQTLGFKHGPNHQYMESTIVQYSPHESYFFIKDWRLWLRRNHKDTRLSPFQDNEYTRKLFQEFIKDDDSPEVPKPMFLHLHSATIDPFTPNPLYDSKTRIMGEKYKSLLGDVDWELKFNTLAKQVICSTITDEKFLTSLRLDQKALCEKMTGIVEFLSKT